jgi:hypothetical protein
VVGGARKQEERIMITIRDTETSDPYKFDRIPTPAESDAALAFFEGRLAAKCLAIEVENDAQMLVATTLDDRLKVTEIHDFRISAAKSEFAETMRSLVAGLREFALKQGVIV